MNGSVKVWDLGTSDLKCLNELATEENAPTSCLLIQSDDLSEEQLLTASNHGYVFVWNSTDTREFEPIAKFRLHEPGSCCLRTKISPDCRHLVTASSDCTSRHVAIIFHFNFC